MKNILILGGTQFIGRNLVERLIKMDGYKITLFNRQRTQSNLFPTVNKIKGDRETDDVKKIANQKWDYVIDLSCYYPGSLQSVLESINHVEKYIFISTCSVYDNEYSKTPLRNEQAKILPCSSDQKTDRSPASYGNRKAACERVLKASGLPYVMLRPALVFGNYDHTDRLYYWLYQAKNKHTLLLPEQGERTFSTTYVHDLVHTILLSLENKNSLGVYNVITNSQTSIKQIVEIAGQYMQCKFSTVNGSADFLIANKISQWTDMPLWINGDHFTYSNQKLQADFGIQMTQFRKSIEDTIMYYEQLNWHVPQYGITEQRRLELLEKI